MEQNNDDIALIMWTK